jgi:acyl-CoA synthetase (AMP-forming)/AMP-acid ligase II
MHVSDPVPTTLIGLTSSISSERTALIQPEHHIRLSYGELRAQVQVLAEHLAALGVKRGDRIGIALPNGIPSIVSFLAASEAGTAAPLNPAYKEEEFRFYLEDTNARVLLLPPDGAEEARRAAGNAVQVVTVDMDANGTVTLNGGKAGRVPVAPAAIDDTALVLHTSGSTGRPKRVPLSHANLSVSAQNVARTYALTGDDVTMCVMPLFHVHGLVASTLGTLATGGAIVVPRKFNPLSFWRVAREYGITWYSAVPTIHQLLLARTGAGGRPEGAEQLRFIRSCSAALPPQVMQDLETAFGAPVLEAYGMTEAAHQMTSNPLPPGHRHPGSVGQGTGVRVSIMDADGRHLPPGERGEVVIKGPNVVKGYENNPEANATSFVDGWFRTGDQGFLDEDGYLRLVARIKELIIRGGEKISPREIDEVLLTHPAVAEAVCFGVPHKTWGEEVAAAVVLRDAVTKADLLAFCREHLAEFRRPKHIYITDAIPRTATGKIQRRVVAQAFSKAS